MYKAILKTLCMGILSMYSVIASSQVTTIDYAASSLSTTACNVFNPSVAVAGVTHKSHAGGVNFTASSGINLTTIPGVGTSPAGTAYVVDYPFLPGEEYTIAITAVGNNAIFLKTSVVPDLSQYPTNSNANCTTDTYVFGYNLTGFGKANFGLTPTTATYNIPAFTITGSIMVHSLIVWTIGGRPNLSFDAMTISKIVISKKVNIVPTFTISPASVTVPCGSSISPTFTVTNVNSTPGVTSYNWDLGSASNGWIYNGNPAPQIISTPTNTLQLTSGNCVNTLGNITVTAVTASTTYPANNSVTTDVTIPAYTLTGPTDFCTTGDYTISNLPCGASVTWSISPAGVASLNTTTGTQVTVTKITAGKVIVRAHISSSCGNFQAGRIAQMADPFPLPGISSNVFCQPGNIVVPHQFSVYNDPGNTFYYWSYTKNGGSRINLSYTIPNIAHKFNLGSYELFVVGENACGESDEASTTFNVLPCPNRMVNRIKISPNPAVATLNIEMNPDQQGQARTATTAASIQMVELIDQTGIVSYRQKFAKGTTTLSLPVSQFKKGIYTLRVFDGTEWIAEKVIIRH